ncbi:MAG: MerR family transcriptional regulator [Desulfovibrionaceae bacterium]|nr:MerR family transcriptional regulator [Desulfovibrionaceae bacterium]MDD4952607.1 MerR family transcriptional regulator [Desulfovibrionaceae bacterium]
MTELGKYKTYKIGQAAKILDLKPYVLRFWESEFERLKPVRTASGQRLYTDEHIKLLRKIKRLLYAEGLTIEGARKRLDEDGRSDFLRQVYDELSGIRDLLG